MLSILACVATMVYKPWLSMVCMIREKSKLEMNRLPNYCFAILVLFTLGALGQPLGESLNTKDVYSNFFHLNPPVNDDIKGKFK